MGRERIMVGRFGENAALEFLKRKRYRVMERNFRTPFGEIDIVARKDGLIVFLEVKTRLTSSLGPPYLSVTGLKQRHLTRSALAYLKWRGLLDAPARIDVVSVKLNCGYRVEGIEIIENAVEG